VNSGCAGGRAGGTTGIRWPGWVTAQAVSPVGMGPGTVMGAVGANRASCCCRTSFHKAQAESPSLSRASGAGIESPACHGWSRSADLRGGTLGAKGLITRRL
jgi:hypothetical protein